ncbi:4-hydroxyacetophenone monooxygenase [Nymphon striatum]|nr:4-hydroxyacetophenone monooxygenase [Nymphon striatum]
MHCGRVAHADNKPADAETIAPSAITATGDMYTDTAGMQPFDDPREMTADEIIGAIDEHARATSRALEAGFDGPITETAEELLALLTHADTDLLPLLPALAYALGDLSLLVDDLRPDPAKVMEEQAGWTAEQQERCVAIALPALERVRSGEAASEPNLEDLHQIMAWTCGVDLSGSYVTMLAEELAPNNADLRAPDWSKMDVAPDRPFKVAIVGAGMSGILAAHRMQQAGVDYVKHDWPQYHSSQDVLLKYFNDCADEWDIRKNVQFGVEVTAMVWDEATSRWAIETTSENGEEVVYANAVVSAVGQLNQPSFPDIEGIDQWDGPSWHSARWNHDVDLAGKRVGVIGSGCSALQLIPKVAAVAGHTTVFQTG